MTERPDGADLGAILFRHAPTCRPQRNLVTSVTDETALTPEPGARQGHAEGRPDGKTVGRTAG
ncbi:hypothetical protein BU197_15880 [Streptomyces sp. CBMA291]|nr:hypothetical protein [Streptomyces sp. CBMA291]MBD0717672.1 hypothetical protein [Streptomyces sp. CBMA370]